MNADNNVFLSLLERWEDEESSSDSSEDDRIYFASVAKVHNRENN